jgi:hypothetical protein
MIVTILISLLGTFLGYWLQKWLKSKFGGPPGLASWSCPPQSELAASKQEFLDTLKWKIWLGPGRTKTAGILFDKAVAKYQPPIAGSVSEVSDIIPRAFGTGDFDPLVKAMTAGLTAD